MRGFTKSAEVSRKDTFRKYNKRTSAGSRCEKGTDPTQANLRLFGLPSVLRRLHRRHLSGYRSAFRNQWRRLTQRIGFRFHAGDSGKRAAGVNRPMESCDICSGLLRRRKPELRRLVEAGQGGGPGIGTQRSYSVMMAGDAGGFSFRTADLKRSPELRGTHGA